jgi:hypothetical protein
MFFAVEFRYLTDDLYRKDRLTFVFGEDEHEAHTRFFNNYRGARIMQWKSRQDEKMKSVV